MDVNLVAFRESIQVRTGDIQLHTRAVMGGNVCLE
jgi:hypothetical protein